MQSIRIRGDLLILLDPELNRTLRRMNNQQNPTNLGDGVLFQPSLPIDVHNQVIANNPADDALRMHPPSPRTQEFYRGNMIITNSDGPLVLPHLPHGHTFVVTSSLMMILTARGLFSGLPSEDPHSHIAKLSSFCKIFVGLAHFEYERHQVAGVSFIIDGREISLVY